MQITNVKLRRVAGSQRVLASGQVVFDDCFVVNDVKVIEGQNGLYVAMPSRRTPNGEFKDIAHPINTETREMLQNAVLEAYNSLEEPDQEVIN